MREIFSQLMSFIAMNAPFQNVRIAMYRKAGIRIGKVLEFGSNNWLGVNFRNLINIEDGVLMAGYIQILSHSFLFQAHPKGYGNEKDAFFPVIIKKGARIGMHVIILPGVIIGENSVIGAGAVVANNIPPNCVAVGAPAKPVKYFDSVDVKSNVHVKKDLDQPMLYVKCKKCGIEFWSAIRCNKKIFRNLDLRSNCHCCPNLHKKQYNKIDYYYKD
jgi:acetyltransferase-like isoleucine patch superfamily enzyme